MANFSRCSLVVVSVLISGSTLAQAPNPPTNLMVDGVLGGGNAGNVANIWLDANGGSCTRQLVAGAYADSQACATLDAAYGASLCGDVVRVKAGNYPSQTIFEKSAQSACVSTPIEFRAEAGARPTINWIRMGSGVGECANDGPDNITMIGFAVTWGIDIEQDSSNIVIDDFTGGSFGMGGGICGSPNNVPPNNITIKNSEWGPCHSGGGAGQDCRNQYPSDSHNGQNKISDGASNVLIENNVIHDFTLASPDHFECVWVGGGNNVTIRRNHFYNCVTNAIAMPDTEIEGTWIIENNWFGDPGPIHAAMKFGLGGGSPTGNVYIRFNSFGGTQASVGNEEGGSANGKIHVIGNIMGKNFGCISGAVYRSNLFVGDSGCDATDRQIPSLPYVDASGRANGNYHLSGTSLADGFVPGSVADSLVTFDWDGDVRSAPRDAGADER